MAKTGFPKLRFPQTAGFTFARRDFWGGTKYQRGPKPRLRSSEMERSSGTQGCHSDARYGPGDKRRAGTTHRNRVGRTSMQLPERIPTNRVGGGGVGEPSSRTLLPKQSRPCFPRPEYAGGPFSKNHIVAPGTEHQAPRTESKILVPRPRGICFVQKPNSEVGMAHNNYHQA